MAAATANHEEQLAADEVEFKNKLLAATETLPSAEIDHENKMAAATAKLEEQLAAVKVEFNNKLSAAAAKYVALVGVANIEDVENILQEHRQVEEKKKVVLERHAQHLQANEIAREAKEKARKTWLLLKSSVEDFEGARRSSQDDAAAQLASRLIYKRPNPKRRKKLKAAAAVQSAGNLPTLDHHDLWNSPVISFDTDDNMLTFF